MRIELNQGTQSAAELERSPQNALATGGSAASSAFGGSATGPARLGENGPSESILGEDQAQLSGAHLQVQALAAQASQLPEVRQERVSALRQAVESGNYSPSPEQVAGALLSHMMAEPAA